MQQIYSQEYAGTDAKVFVLDEPGPGNGCHQYSVEIEAGGKLFKTDTNFQKGPVLKVGPNGIQNEHLLAMVIHRLQGFQSGPYACNENAYALNRIQEGLFWLEERTKDRSNRGVEGKNEA
ncbi:MAG: hypothetical protein AAF959_11340 [Cyanobacteria bacterium P01_D01_bin.56]